MDPALLVDEVVRFTQTESALSVSTCLHGHHWRALKGSDKVQVTCLFQVESYSVDIPLKNPPVGGNP